MARISQDDDSWKAGGVKRRDFRQIKNGPEVSKKNAKKDTKKWCKGKVGREHVPVVTVKSVGHWGYSIIACSTCGKHIKYLWNKNL